MTHEIEVEVAKICYERRLPRLRFKGEAPLRKVGAAVPGRIRERLESQRSRD
jgi:hypothetical protein